MTHALIYISQATIEINEEVTKDIAQKSALNNKKTGITGFLIYRANTFVQYIEGEKEAIYNLMSVIEDDPRHKILKTVPLKFAFPKFFGWNMRYVPIRDVKRLTMNDTLMSTIQQFVSEDYSEELMATQLNTIINSISRNSDATI